MGTGKTGFGGDVDSGLGGVTDGGGGGYRRDRYEEKLNWWEDNVAHVTLGTETNAPLIYDPVLELHHTIMSKIGDTGYWLEREREIEMNLFIIQLLNLNI